MKELIFIVTVIDFGKRTGLAKSFTQQVLGKPLLYYNLQIAKEFSPSKIFLVLDRKSESLKEIIKNEIFILIVEKWEQIFKEVFKTFSNAIEEKEFILLRGEFPLITFSTLRSLIKEHYRKKNSLTLLTSSTDDRKIGALIFNGKILSSIDKIEFKKGGLKTFIDSLSSFLLKEGERVEEVLPQSEDELISAGKTEEFSKIIEVLRLRKIEEIKGKGVKVLDPLTTWIDQDVKIGKETIIYPFTLIEGKTVIGKRCVIYPFSHIRDCEISDNVNILTSSFLEGAKVMKGASVGPYSRIRPGTLIESRARIGNFVEVKNTIVGKRSKALHLTYLGDAKIGSDVNVGAGTITCNFDGKNKNVTIIESGSFIGSGTELVAPVKVGKKSYIGAGSTITKDVPPYALGIARERQTNIEKWVKRRKK